MLIYVNVETSPVVGESLTLQWKKARTKLYVAGRRPQNRMVKHLFLILNSARDLFFEIEKKNQAHKATTGNYWL